MWPGEFAQACLLTILPRVLGCPPRTLRRWGELASGTGDTMGTWWPTVNHVLELRCGVLAPSASGVLPVTQTCLVRCNQDCLMSG